MRRAITSYGGPRVEWGIVPSSISVDSTTGVGDDVYPVKVTLQCTAASGVDITNSVPPTTNNGILPKSGLLRSNLVVDNTDALIRDAEDSHQTKEGVSARYMIACDGGQSWTRRQLGF